jgi:hypothetical protein
MKASRLFCRLSVSALSIALASPALGLANRVFVSARSGNNANACDNINTPCQTFAGAVVQLNPGGEAIVLDSGGYGPVTITQSLTIEAPPGVLAFIHPPSGDAITINAGPSDKVTLRGLTLNVGVNGITVNAVGTLTVENCFITGFSNAGIRILGTGAVQATIDHCHLSGNYIGFFAATTSPGSSTTTASYSTANNNLYGWDCGDGSSGKDVLNLEFCAGSGNSQYGLLTASTNAQSAVRYSNCVFTNNGVGVVNGGSGTMETRQNNTVTGNGIPTFGPIISFPAM